MAASIKLVLLRNLPLHPVSESLQSKVPQKQLTFPSLHFSSCISMKREFLQEKCYLKTKLVLSFVSGPELVLSFYH